MRALRRGGKAMRLRGLVIKEWLQVLRDPSSIAIAFVMPVVLLLLFGYGVSLNAKHVPVALVIDQPDAQTEALRGAFGRSEYLRPVSMADMPAARAALARHRVDAVVHLPARFGNRVLLGDGPAIRVILNGVDANKARIVQGYIEGIWSKWLQQLPEARVGGLREPVELRARIWFNSNARSRDYLVPGLIAVIMTLTGALLTALVMAREWERGTMEALMVTPAAMSEVLLGKLIPYFLLGMGGMAMSVAMAVWLFQVPLRGSVWLLFAVAGLFMLVALGMGLLISVISRNQFVAGMAAIIVTFLPAFLLSGFIFDIHSMPVVIQAITYVVPARYFVSALQTLFLAGNVWPVLLPDIGALLLMALFFLGFSAKRSRKRLD